MSRKTNRIAAGGGALLALLYISFTMEQPYTPITAVVVPLFALLGPGFAILVWTPLPAAYRYGLTPPLSVAFGVLAAWLGVEWGHGDSLVPQQLVAFAAALALLAYAAWEPQTPQNNRGENREPR